MFNNFVKWSTGRTNIKVISMVLVITLTFANFALIGSSIANDNLNSNDLNADNVRFEVYLDENDRTKTALEADLNAQDLTLYAAIKVENEGRLENAKINVLNANIKLKGEESQFEKSIGTIAAGDEQIIPIQIEARKDDVYDLRLLNMDSQIVLTGTYYNSNEEITQVSTTKQINIRFNTNSLTNEDVFVSQQVVTNKIYKIGEENRRVVQLLVRADLQDNKAPIELKKIELKVPSFEQIYEVNVVGVTAKGTNEKLNIESVYNLDYDLYEYNLFTGDFTINVLNRTENNKITWRKDVQEFYLVTYVYAEDVEFSEETPFISNAKVTFDVCGRTEEDLYKEDTLSLEELEENGEIFGLDRQTPGNIYKGCQTAQG